LADATGDDCRRAAGAVAYGDTPGCLVVAGDGAAGGSTPRGFSGTPPESCADSSWHYWPASPSPAGTRRRGRWQWQVRSPYSWQVWPSRSRTQSPRARESYLAGSARCRHRPVVASTPFFTVHDLRGNSSGLWAGKVSTILGGPPRNRLSAKPRPPRNRSPLHHVSGHHDEPRPGLIGPGRHPRSRRYPSRRGEPRRCVRPGP
jgi:hypothetical protein